MTSSIGKRRRLTPQRRREELIALGVRMLSERTLDELSIDELAAAAGVSRGLLFHYFASKSDFRLAVVTAACAELIAVTEPDPSRSPAEQVSTSMGQFVDYITANRAGYLSLVRGAASGDAALREVFTRTREALAQRIVDLAADLGAAGTPRLQLAVRGWLAYVEEISVVWLTGHEDDATRADVLSLAGEAFAALIAPPRRATGDEPPSLRHSYRSSL